MVTVADVDVRALVAFLRRCLDEDEQVVVEASRYGYGSDTIPDGASWRWEHSYDDHVIEIDPLTDEFVGDGPCSLRSVQTHESYGMRLPQMAIAHAEEVPAAVGLHIARWDPSAVLAVVQALRDMLDEHCAYYGERPDTFFPVRVISRLARAYRGRPGWREEWDALIVDL